MADNGLSSAHLFIKGLIQDPTHNSSRNPNPNPNPSKRKRNLPGTPDPDAEVIALSPNSLMATNRFVCEICNKGFRRDQNLQLHKRGHNLPWKLKRRTNKEARKKVYICPEKTCVHHDPSRALGDLTGIKKHFSRKHGEKKWTCEKCSKKYAVQSDWKAHSKICGTRGYKCDCGTLFSRKDSYITHRAFCDALIEDSARFCTPVPSVNLSFRKEQVMHRSVIDFQNPDNSHFSGVFRPELGGLLESGNHINLDSLQKPRPPMWVDDANSYLNHSIRLNPSSSSTNFFVTTSASMSPELVQITSQNNPWFNRGQEETFEGGDTNVSASTSFALPRVLQEEEENKGRNFSEALSSLYYSNNNQNQKATMSATGLSQKAAQMASTSTGTSSIFDTRFGLLSSALSTLGSFNSLKQSANEGHQILGEVENSFGRSSHGGKSSGIEGKNSLTKDFLGAGGNAPNPSFLAREC